MDSSNPEARERFKERLRKLLQAGAGTLVLATSTLAGVTGVDAAPARRDATLLERAAEVREEAAATQAAGQPAVPESIFAWWNWRNWHNGWPNGWRNWHNWRNW
jgi:hypothetical protein